jgi:hypothetical protein
VAGTVGSAGLGPAFLIIMPKLVCAVMPSRRIKVAVVGRLVANYGSEGRLGRPGWPPAGP